MIGWDCSKLPWSDCRTMETGLLVGTYGEKLVHVQGKGKGVYAYYLRIERNKSGDISANLQNTIGTGAHATWCLLTWHVASSFAVYGHYYQCANSIVTNVRNWKRRS